MKRKILIPLVPLSVLLIGIAILFLRGGSDEKIVNSPKPVATSTPVKNTPQKNEPVNFYPEKVFQGEPLLIEINKATSSVRSVKFNDFYMKVLPYAGKSISLIGFDVHKQAGKYPVLIEFTDGTSFSKVVEVYEKEKVEKNFDIPEKLGGNTPESQKALVASLAEENRDLQKLYSESFPLWSGPFGNPLKEMAQQDPFGYPRKTGALVVYHKGVDLKADEGTSVFAVNDGIVRKAVDSRNYGKAIVIDHGVTVMSFYLHLSEIKVFEGQRVKKGDLIGLSGESGYAEGPHLHFSIRIANVSVDPLRFLEIFK